MYDDTQEEINRVMDKALLRSVLPFVQTDEEWKNHVCALAKIVFIQYDQSPKDKRFNCLRCPRKIDNLLLLILHLQLDHAEQCRIVHYEFINDTLRMKVDDPDPLPMKFFSDHNGSHEMIYSPKTRFQKILSPIFSKFVRKTQMSNRQYFHSADVFREIGEDSMDQDSEDDIGQVQRELQKLRISQFTDVGQNDKDFFLRWNEAVWQALKQHRYLDRRTLYRILIDFAKQGKKQGLKRINLVVHCYTLWSTGKITCDDILEVLNNYDCQ